MKIVGLFVLLIGFASCREKNETNVFNDPKNQKGTDLKKDADFLEDAAKINREAISLAKLAQQNSIKPKIQNIARNFENTHTRLYKELKSIADKKSITISSVSIDMKSNRKMKNEIADDFDALYFSKIANDYKYAIERFEYEAHNSKDKEISFWAKTTVPVLRRNLGIAIVLQEEINNKKNLK